MKYSYLSKTSNDTKRIGFKLASELTGGEVVCLYGQLGAGKTVFVQGMVEYFLPGKRVLSPTFIIVRHYDLGSRLIKRFLHVDLYRLSDLKEIKNLEFFESINKPCTVLAIEWAEKLQNLIPKKRIDIRMKVLSDQSRSITIDQITAAA